MMTTLEPSESPVNHTEVEVASSVGGAASVEFDSATLGYGRADVIRSVSLTVRAGQVFALLGRNGSGKSTLVASLMGFRPVRSGSIRVLGSDPWRQRTRIAGRIGFVPEVPDAPPDATVARICRLRSALYSNWDRATVESRLERFAIPSGQRFERLSRGQKGLVQLTLALGHSPELLVLDDPTLGLDAVAKASFYEELIGELADRGVTTFLTTHDLSEVDRIADRIAILHEGRIVAEGSPEGLKADYADRFPRSPELRPTLEDLLRDLTTTTGAIP